MSSGRAKHEEYENALHLLGKDLARRAKSKCELTGEPGTLRIYDLKGPKFEPSLEHVVLVSPEVLEHLEGRGLGERNQLHYLEQAVWSSEAAVRRAALQILEQLDEPWAQEAIDNAKMMDDSEAQDEQW